jgi:hypothetical protein
MFGIEAILVFVKVLCSVPEKIIERFWKKKKRKLFNKVLKE